MHHPFWAMSTARAQYLNPAAGCSHTNRPQKRLVNPAVSRTSSIRRRFSRFWSFRHALGHASIVDGPHQNRRLRHEEIGPLHGLIPRQRCLDVGPATTERRANGNVALTNNQRDARPGRLSEAQGLGVGRRFCLGGAA
jgi:hypothetical protein